MQVTSKDITASCHTKIESKQKYQKKKEKARYRWWLVLLSMFILLKCFFFFSSLYLEKNLYVYGVRQNLTSEEIFGYIMFQCY